MITEAMRDRHRDIDRERTETFNERVAEIRELVDRKKINPRRPTQFAIGTRDKMALMAVRSEKGIPIFIDGDNRDCGEGLETPKPQGNGKEFTTRMGIPRVCRFARRR